MMADDSVKASRKQFDLNLVASDHPVFTSPAKFVVIPDVAGSMGFLPGHEPVLTILGKGRVRIVDAEGNRHFFDVDGGFASFDENKLTVAVPHCSEELHAAHSSAGEQA